MLLNVPNYRVRLNVAIQPEMIFFAFVQRWIKRNEFGHCFVAGSYALHTMMRAIGLWKELHESGFVPNDIDIYVTIDDRAILDTMLTHFQINNPMYKLTSIRQYNTYSGAFLQSHISGILELDLSHEFFDRPFRVQLIMLWSGHRFSVFDVARSVIGAYDISVCKVSMVSANNPLLFYFKDGEDALDVHDLRFSYRFRKHMNMKTGFLRVNKYCSRGFNLNRILFDNKGQVTFHDSVSVCSSIF